MGKNELASSLIYNLNNFFPPMKVRQTGRLFESDLSAAAGLDVAPRGADGDDCHHCLLPTEPALLRRLLARVSPRKNTSQSETA